MKRFLAIMLTLAVIVFSATRLEVKAETNEASESDRSIEYCSEYDYLVAMRSVPREVAERAGTADRETLDRIYSDFPEKELLRRATLSDEELTLVYLYSPEQIAVLRNYDGTPLEKAPQMKALAATITGYFTPVIYSGTMAGMMFSWEWSTLPVFKATDAVAISWGATYANSGYNNMVLNTSASYAQITYKFLSTGTPFYVNFSPSSTNLYHGAYVEIPFVDSGYGFAHKGFFYVEVSLANTSGQPMVYLVANAQYAHYIIAASAISVSIMSDLSISFSGSYNLVLNKNLHVQIQ